MKIRQRRLHACIRGMYRTLLPIAAFAIISGATLAQSRITNADIIELTKAGLGAETIIQAITTSRPDFDTSPSALVRLKNAGVAESVIQRMMGGIPQQGSVSASGVIPNAPRSPSSPNPFETQPRPKLAETGPQCRLPPDGEHEILISDGAARHSVAPDRVERKVFVSAARTLVSILTLMLVPSEGTERAVIAGGRATLRLKAASLLIEDLFVPTRENPLEVLRVIRLTQDDNTRSFELSKSETGLLVDANTRGMDPKAGISFEIMERQEACILDGNRVIPLRIRVTDALPPGEYAVYVKSSDKLYSFGVD